ncbi:MAG: hypothetical protein ABSF93_09855 [Candidatus Sulfotelmatobacter sp.]|jgi:hypothetical protein
MVANSKPDSSPAINRVFVNLESLIARSSYFWLGGDRTTLYQKRKKTDIVLMVTSL